MKLAKWIKRFDSESSEPWPGDCASIEALTAFNKHTNNYIKQIPPYPGHKFKRGIVYCAGGQKYFTNAWVSVNILRKLGCKLPIQFWTLENEITPTMRELLKPLNVEVIDGTKIDYKPRLLYGWELKALALCYNSFKEVIFLDADNVPIRNPEYLFDTKEFKKTGAIFWPDYGRLEEFRGAWKLAGIS